MPKKNQPSTWKRLIDHGFLALIISILTILFSVVLSQVQSKVGWLALVLGLSFMLALYVSTVWLIQRPIIDVLGEGLTEVSQLVSNSSKSFLYSNHKLEEYERNVNCPDIWILTADLLTEVERDIFKRLVVPNIKRGIRYVYFVPDTPVIRGRIAQMRSQYSGLGKTDEVQLTFLPDTFFFLVANLEIAIYNPLADGNQQFAPRTAFMGLPTTTIAEEGHYYVPIARELVDKLVGQLDPLVARRAD